MSFKQFNVAKIANQSREIFDTYIYKTEDTCAEVEAEGYFDECRFLIRDPDSWNNSIIEVFASDCFTKGIIDNSGNYIPLLGVDGFCVPLGLSLAAFQQFATSIITGSDVVFNGASDGATVAVSTLSVDTFQLLGGDVWFEWTINSGDANAAVGNCPNAFTDPPPFAEGVVVVVNAAGTEFEMYKCSDAFSAPPPIVVPQNPDFVNKTLNFPYTVQTRMNGTTGEISWEDTNGNSGSFGNWLAITVANLDITMIGFGNTLSLTPVNSSYSVNAGRAAPVIAPPSGFNSWCSYIIPPPVGDCRIIDLSTQLLNDATVLINNNETTVTSLNGTPAAIGVAFFDDELMQAKINSAKFAFEMIAQAPSFLGENVFGAAFGETDVFASNFLGGITLSIPPLGTGVGDWEIGFVSNFLAAPLPILQNLTITFPYIVKVVIDGDNFTFKDNQVPANTGVLGTVVGLSGIFGSFLMVNGVNNSAFGNTQTLRLEGNKDNFVIDFENDALAWCQLEQNPLPPSVPYKFIELFQSGSAMFVDRDAGWVTVNGVGATWIGTASYNFINEEPLDNFVFEFPTAIADLDATTLGKLIRYISGDVFNDTNDVGIITGQLILGSAKTGVSWSSQDTFDNSYTKVLSLFNIPTELDFVVALAVIDSTHVRLCYKTAKQTVFFQEISLRTYGNNKAALVQLNQGSSLLPSGRTYQVKYNGLDDDLLINNYPLNFLGYDGSALPTKTAPENLTASAAWLLDYPLEFDVVGNYIDITNFGKTATSFTTLDQWFLLNCSRFINKDEGFATVGVTYQINGLVSGGTNPNAFRFDLEAMNRQSKCAIELVGIDLVLTRLTNGVLQPAQIIKANYVAALGDQLCLVMDNGTGAVRAYLQQGGVLYDTGFWTCDAAVNTSWMPRAGHDNANGTNAMVMANQYLEFDLPVGVLKTELILIGAVDILLNLYA